MASPVFIWFHSEVYFWRSLASTIWAVICLPIFVIIFSFLSGVSLTHPYQWLYDTVMNITSLQFWIVVLIIAMCLILVTWFSLRHLTVVPEVQAIPFMSYLRLFRWSCLPLMVICSLSGAVSSWSLSGLLGKNFESLTRVKKTETHERVVLNEQHLFIVLAGIFGGLSYFRYFFQHQHFYLAFPHIQRFKLFQMRSEISNLLKSCMWQSLHTVKYFYICYFLLGTFPKKWIVGSFNIGLDPDDTPLNSLTGLLSLTLLWQTFLVSSTLIVAWSFARMLLKIFHTEHLEFPIISIMEYDKQRTLPDALACSYSPVLQHLAFLDLNTAAKFSPSRRQELLSLSQPGGHPRIWASVSGSTFTVVRELTDRIREENWAIMSKVSLNAHLSEMNTAFGSKTFTDSSSVSYRGADPNMTGAQDFPAENQKPPLTTKFYNLLQGLPFVSQLLAESPDVSSRKLFASCQIQIWAVEALSLMGGSSYTEDIYGVVQNTLPEIFGTLLDLHECMEKHFKLTASIMRRPSGATAHSSDALLRYKLQSANKAAIYRLVNTYRQHLEDLRLSMEYAKKLQPFVEYLV